MISLTNRINDTSLTVQQITNLQLLAAKCPFTDGVAVYQARALLAPIDSTVYFNFCESYYPNSNNERLANNEEDADNTIDFKLHPNPNNGNMIIEYTINQNAEFIIYDIFGKEVNRYILDANSNTLKISEAALKNGIYFYSILVNDRVISNKKIIVLK